MMPQWIAPVAGFALSVLALGCGSSAPSEESSLTSVGLRTPDSPLVSIRIAFQTGSIDDPAGKNGLNALTSLMIGQGGTQTLSYEELTAAVYPWSASLTAQFDKEMTTIIGQVHRDHVEPFLRYSARPHHRSTSRRVGLRSQQGVPDQRCGVLPAGQR